MIKEFEFYHGTIFTRLVHNYGVPVTIKPFPTSSNSSYILNEIIGLYIKYSSKRMSPWRFSMQKLHQDEILQMKKQLKEVFILLVCGEDGIVTLGFDELKQILDHAHGKVEWISATRNPRKEYTIKGSDGKLSKKIGKADFPKKIVELTTDNGNNPTSHNNIHGKKFNWDF
jgi:hypothetical protein